MEDSFQDVSSQRSTINALRGEDDGEMVIGEVVGVGSVDNRDVAVDIPEKRRIVTDDVNLDDNDETIGGLKRERSNIPIYDRATVEGLSLSSLKVQGSTDVAVGCAGHNHDSDKAIGTGDMAIGFDLRNEKATLPSLIGLGAVENGQQNINTNANSYPPSYVISTLPLKKRKIDIINTKFFFPKSVQTQLTLEEIDLLFKYYRDAVDERSQLLLRLSNLVIDVKFFEGNDIQTRFYTGLTTWKLFNNLFRLVEAYLPEHGNSKLSPFQMLALTLMKLRLNLTFRDLGYRFEIDQCTASRYFHRAIFILYKLFFGSKLIHWPEERSKLVFNTPSYFRCAFKEAITIIVDCFEIFIERPSILRALAQAWSHYKHHVTIKYLIGISTTGVILFISEGFGGRCSDKEISVKSGFIDKLQEGDLVLADRGFLIEQEVNEKGASLHRPCFVKNGRQLEPKDVEETRYIANVRIHVERLISVVRQKYNVCSDAVSMKAISKQDELFDKDLYDQILFVCCCLVNLCPSVVRHDFEI